MRSHQEKNNEKVQRSTAEDEEKVTTERYLAFPTVQKTNFALHRTVQRH